MTDEPTVGGSDRHRAKFMVRLPEIFREKLRDLSKRTGRPMTQLVVAALRSFLARFGLWKKQDDVRLVQQEESG